MFSHTERTPSAQSFTPPSTMTTLPLPKRPMRHPQPCPQRHTPDALPPTTRGRARAPTRITNQRQLRPATNDHHIPFPKKISLSVSLRIAKGRHMPTTCAIRACIILFCERIGEYIYTYYCVWRAYRKRPISASTISLLRIPSHPFWTVHRVLVIQFRTAQPVGFRRG